MKKIVALACSVLLVAGMTLTAAAAQSPSGSHIVTGVETAKDGNGNVLTDDVRIVVEDILEEDKPLVEEMMKSVDKQKELLGSKYEEGLQVIDAREVRKEGTGELKFPVTVTFTATGITANHKVILLHYNKTKSKWEALDATAGTGTITATFDSFSPVVFLAKEAAADPDAPKTGDSASYLWMIAMVMVAAAGVGVVAKRKRA